MGGFSRLIDPSKQIQLQLMYARGTGGLDQESERHRTLVSRRVSGERAASMAIAGDRSTLSASGALGAAAAGTAAGIGWERGAAAAAGSGSVPMAPPAKRGFVKAKFCARAKGRNSA